MFLCDVSGALGKKSGVREREKDETDRQTGREKETAEEKITYFS